DRLVAFSRPRSLAAEQYRAIRTQLATFSRTTPIRTMAITSALAGEGKTTTAANLALTLAQEVGRRVCLVDADLRSPQVHTLFGLAPRDGLADVLRRRAELDAALLPTPINDLWLLTAGHLPPNPAELLGSTAMREVLGRLRDTFDLVVVDTPPVVPLPDPAILAGLVDGVALVVLAGRTPRRLVDRALDRLHGATFLGFVLNATDEFRYYAYYYYNYGT
ncbi:MAG TPA: CpsD/CapB family tyrosine-protein kinase, partial [Thermodesulfobacteriota bacterium]|nr:CpsD/CapB family tyrosine-protein kinase [Thermodesulfobacteriota bacterium]